MNRLVPLSLILIWLFSGACGRSPKYYLDKGDALASGGKYEDAIINYRKAIAAQPANGEAYYRLGSVFLQLRRPQEAYPALSRAADLLPARDDVAAKLGDLSFSAYISGQRRQKALYDKALSMSSRLLGRNAQSWDGLRLKANLAASDARLKDAEVLYAAANQVRPMQPQLVVSWAQVLFADHQAEKAEALVLQLIDGNKNYGPAYDLLYSYYQQSGRASEAEKILRLRSERNPSDVAGLLELATLYAASSREAEMQEVLRRMLDKPGTFPDAHLQVGDLYARLHRWDAALAEFEAGGRAEPKQRIAYLKRAAEVWLAQGKAPEANKVVDQILTAQPDDAAAQGMKANLLLDSGRPENTAKAVAQLKTLVEKHPDDAGLRFSLGRGLAATGDREAARVQLLEAVKRRPALLQPRMALLDLSQAQGDYKTALQEANAILAISPGLPQIRFLRAVSLVNTGNEAAGRTELKLLAQALPKNRDVRLEIATLDLRDQKFQDAEEAFDRLMKEDERDLRPLSGLVRTLAAGNQIDKALSVLDARLKKAPDSIPLHSMMAATAAGAGRYDLAIAQYREVLAAAPNSAPAFLALGSVYRLRGDMPNAIASFQKAHALAPGEPAPLVSLGGALAAAGRNTEALECFRQALKLQPDDAALMSNAAYLMAEEGKGLDEALRLAQQAVHRDSQQPNFADTLGWVYYKKREPGSASQVFRSLTEKYPENGTFHYHFGMVLSQQGSREAAQSEFRAALAGHPSDEIRRDATAALAH